VCECGDRCGYLELEFVGGPGAPTLDAVYYFDCGPRHPGAVADLEELLTAEERALAERRHLRHPSEQDADPSAARGYALSEGLREKVLRRLISSLADLPLASVPASITLFVWDGGPGRAGRPTVPAARRSWAGAFLGATRGEVARAVEDFATAVAVRGLPEVPGKEIA
jgi:hypothetical protein